MRRIAFGIMAIGLFLLAQSALADWTGAKRLTWTDGASYIPRIALDSSGHLHLVWYDDTPGHFEIYYKKSTNGGTTWTAARRITWSANSSKYPALAIDSSDRLHMAWTEGTADGSEIFYKRSSDGGDTWTAKYQLTYRAITSEWPDIAMDSLDVIHLVYQDSTGECFYTESPDGTNWMLEKRLSWTSGISQHPKLAVDSSGGLQVVWEDNNPGEYNYEVYYKKSTNSGNTWSAAKRLSWTDGGSFRPVPAAGPSEDLHLVWYDENPTPYEIYYKKSTDAGDSWAATRRLTFDSGGSEYPSLAVDGSGALHLVWEGLNGELTYRKSTDSGSTWTANQRLTWTTGLSWDPRIVADSSGNLHLVWEDNTPLSWEIYYKKFEN